MSKFGRWFGHGRLVVTEQTAKGNALARGERLQIMLDTDELRAVEDFRFTHRMPSRAAAVRELLKRGLAAEGFTVGKPGASSRSFGVVDSSPPDQEDLKRGESTR
jgi:hypothetical protein